MNFFSRGSWRRIGAAGAAILVIWLSVLVVIKPELQLSIKADIASDSQVFIPNVVGRLSESDSLIFPIVNRHTYISVPLGVVEIGKGWVRLDPISVAGSVVIANPRIRIFSFEYELTADNLIPVSGVDAFRTNDRQFVVSSSSDDPQLLINLPRSSIFAAKAIIATIVTLLMSLLWAFRSRLAPLSIPWRLLFNVIADDRSRFQVVTLALMCIAVWWYPLSTYSISVDQEFAAYRTDHRVWISQGRWLSYLLSSFLLPQPVVPYFPVLIFNGSLLTSYILILTAHRMPLGWREMAIFPVFVAFPFWYLIAEFYANLLSVAIGMMLVSSALVMFAAEIGFRAGSSPLKVRAPLIVLCGLQIGIATGAYQSFLPTFATMASGCILWHLAIRRDMILPALYVYIKELAIVCVVAVLSYYAIDAIFKASFGVSTSYVDGMNRIDLLLNAPFSVLSSTLAEGWAIYSGSPSVYGVSLWGFGAIGFTAVYLLLAYACSSRRIMLAAVAALLACLCGPLILNLVAGGAKTIPYRSMVGVSYVVWLLAAVIVYTAPRRFVVAKFLILAISILQLMNAHANYNALRTLTWEHDKALAAAIYARIINEVPNFDRFASVPVDIYGAKKFHSPFPRVETSTIGASFFEWDGGWSVRILTFMKLLGYDGLEPVPPHFYPDLVEIYDTMPIWPAKGSVRQHKGMVLIKMGTEPGISHSY